jgi:hypothetical protein
MIHTTWDTYEMLSALRDALYSAPGCSVGGPLHVQLDDGNLEDHFVADDAIDQYPYLDEYDASVIALCRCILTILRGLSEHERLVWYCGSENVAKFLEVRS